MRTESSAVALVPSAAAHSVPSFATKQLGLGQDKLDACGQGNELQVGITALYNVSIVGGQLQGGPLVDGALRGCTVPGTSSLAKPQAVG